MRGKRKLYFYAARIFQSREDLPPSLFCEKYVWLSEKVSPMAGYFSLATAPYMAAMLDDLWKNEPGKWREILMKATQVGGSLYLQLTLLYVIVNAPAPSPSI